MLEKVNFTKEIEREYKNNLDFLKFKINLFILISFLKNFICIFMQLRLCSILVVLLQYSLFFFLLFFRKWNVSSLQMIMWYRSHGKGEIFYLFFSELLQILIIVQEDGRSMKTPLPIGLSRVAVFPTRKSQLCVCVSFIIKVCKKQKAFTYNDDSFHMYKLNRFSKTPLSLIYCGISRAPCPNIANAIFLTLKNITISRTLLKSNHHLIAAYGCC